jgi:hypothetical protein
LLRVIEYVLRQALFHDIAVVHENYSIGDVLCEPHLMRYEHPGRYWRRRVCCKDGGGILVQT